jgi:hypothetical protein
MNRRTSPCRSRAVSLVDNPPLGHQRFVRATDYSQGFLLEQTQQ